mmetsp:Transcript_9119/g.13727  ORF Transcript_9119/g.13727 Transcript_9119/m.13727 type:complete len:181 (-) Transcript_9119:175-717(-)
MHCYRVVKILFIEPTQDTPQRGLDLERDCQSHVDSHVLVDFTVVRDCLTGLEQMDMTDFNMVMVSQNVKHITGMEFLTVLRKMGIHIPVIYVAESVVECSEDTVATALSLGFFSVLQKPISPDALGLQVLRCLKEPCEQHDRGEESMCYPHPRENRVFDASIIDSRANGIDVSSLEPVQI